MHKNVQFGKTIPYAKWKQKTKKCLLQETSYTKLTSFYACRKSKPEIIDAKPFLMARRILFMLFVGED
jgi:hypothetical protein